MLFSGRFLSFLIDLKLEFIKTQNIIKISWIFVHSLGKECSENLRKWLMNNNFLKSNFSNFIIYKILCNLKFMA